MSEFIPWNSQSLEAWASQHSHGKFITLKGKKTHYIEKGEGSPLILLHGFFYDSWIWKENIDVLAQRFKVYALDLWGCGLSTREPLEYGYSLFAQELELFMEELGLASACLVGQSMGSGTAIYFAVHHPEKVKKLLLVASAGMHNPMPLSGRLFCLPFVGEFLMRWNTDWIRKKNIADFWVHDSRRITAEYFEEVTRFQKIQGTTQALLSMLRKQFFDKLEEEISRLAEKNIPTLIVAGKEDKAVPLACLEKMHRVLKNSRLEVLSPCGHIPNFEQAAPFNELALKFLSE